MEQSLNVILSGALERLQSSNFLNHAPAPKAMFGFDGYIDSLYAVVKQTQADGIQQTFQTSNDFLYFLNTLKGQSSERELLLKHRRAGGNAPLTAIAAGALGVDAHCIGFLGNDLPEFYPMRRFCRMTSLGPPAECIALEFSNCKWMLSNLKNFRDFTAKGMLEHIGHEALCMAFREASLIALFNWAGMRKLTEVVQMLLDDLWDEAYISGKTFFFDFSDISSQPMEAFRCYIDLLKQIADRTNVIISMNSHEAETAATIYGITWENETSLLWGLYKCLGIQELVLHTINHAISIRDSNLIKCMGYFNPNPSISTGGGDYFNGGFCAALLAGLAPEDCLAVATATALYYIANAHCGSIEEIVNYIYILGKNTHST